MKACAVFGGDQAREDLDAASVDGEVMVAAAEALAAAFDDAQPPALAAIDRRQLIEMDDAVRDAVHGAVGALGRQIVEHDDGRVGAGRNNASAPGSAGDSAASFAPAAGFRTGCRSRRASASAARSRRRCAGSSRRARGRTNRAGSGAVRGRARFPAAPARRSRSVADGPAVRAGAVPQLMFGLGKADINSRLVCRCAGQQKLQRDRGFAGARAAFEQMQAIARQAAAQHVIESRNSGGGAGQKCRHRIHAQMPFDQGVLEYWLGRANGRRSASWICLWRAGHGLVSPIGPAIGSVRHVSGKTPTRQESSNRVPQKRRAHSKA